MNKLPNAIYIQLDRTWTPDDNCSPLEGATHNEERITPDDVEYVRADLPVDPIHAMSLFVRGKGNCFYVPCVDTGKIHVVDFGRGSVFCHDESHALCSRGTCEHVKAVEEYLEQRGIK